MTMTLAFYAVLCQLETESQYRAAAEGCSSKIKTGKEVKVDSVENRAPDFSLSSRAIFIGPASDAHGGPQAVGRKSARLHPHVPRIRRDYQFDRHFFGPGAERLPGHQRRNATAIRPNPLPWLELLPFKAKRRTEWTSTVTTILTGSILRTRPMTKPFPHRASHNAQGTGRTRPVAPINEPSVGPKALLTGRAAAVFFHEVFGHPRREPSPERCRRRPERLRKRSANQSCRVS